ncbi:DUF4864 domain-containing protein [Celeribacter litoreus]|uniref:DUF4864 domain-containing protein n=1 Tax=Celeribacter litoreus TaxID=2876714 RepID=UPI001CC94AF4|nr:DUF4864 domain-containing protein [Celeribacter litoreus]MCA0044146.1 DUF4864 domain-containing protein [Celeribacter litoreus]
MSALKSLIFVTALWAAPLAADPLEDVISDQLAEFREGDVLGAWSHASPNIREFFGTPDTFAHVVENGYETIWSNTSARFMGREETGGRVQQTVVVEGQSGRIEAYVYYMIETEDGWKIDGVEPTALPDIAV